MSLGEKDRIMEFRKDLITLIRDSKRVIWKQENLVYFGQFTEEEARKNIEKFEEDIQNKLELIRVLEKQLEKEYNIKEYFSY